MRIQCSRLPLLRAKFLEIFSMWDNLVRFQATNSKFKEGIAIVLSLYYHLSTFKPKLNDKSLQLAQKHLTSEKPVVDLLYKDASERKEKLQKLEKKVTIIARCYVILLITYSDYFRRRKVFKKQRISAKCQPARQS